MKLNETKTIKDPMSQIGYPTFRCDDLYTSAGLKSLGLDFLGIDRQGNRTYFLFEGGNQAQDKLQEYLQDKNKVRTALNNLRDLKNLIFSRGE